MGVWNESSVLPSDRVIIFTAARAVRGPLGPLDVVDVSFLYNFVLFSLFFPACLLLYTAANRGEFYSSAFSPIFVLPSFLCHPVVLRTVWVCTDALKYVSLGVCENFLELKRGEKNTTFSLCKKK